MIITVIDIKTRREYQIEARSNGENAVKCPVCADDRKKKTVKSMTFNAQKQVGHCHHCDARFIEKGAGGSQMRPEPKVYTKPRWENHTQLSDEAVRWFASRGITQKTLIDMKVTETEEWMPQTGKIERCICFNYYRDGQIVNIKYRTY